MKRIHIILLFVLLLFTFLFVLSRDSTLEVNLNKTYVLDYPYDKVKRVLSLTDVLGEILEYEHGKVVDKKFNKFVISGNKPLREGIEIDGEFYFLVEKDDPEMGKYLLRFRNKVFIGKSKFDSETTLIEPAGYIRQIKNTMEVLPEGDKTIVNLSNQIIYKRRLPIFMIKHVTTRVTKAAEDSLSNNEKAVRFLVNKYIDKQIILPIHIK